MKRKMTGFTTIVLILVGVWALVAYAEKAGGKKGRPATKPNQSAKSPMGETPDRGPGGGGPFSIDSLTYLLDLNDAQKSKMQIILKDYRKEQIMKGAQNQIAELEFSELMDDPNPDLAKIEEKSREIADLEADLRIFRIKKLFETKSFLAADQFSKFKDFVSRMVGDRRGMRGQMDGMPGMENRQFEDGKGRSDRRHRGKFEEDDEDEGERHEK